MEDKKTIKVNLSTVILLFVIFVLLAVLGGMYFYYNFFEKSDEIVEENKNGIKIDEEDILVGNKVEEENFSENDKNEDKEEQKNPYEKYKDLFWYFNEKGENKFSESLKELKWSNDKIVIEDSIPYFVKNGTKKKIEAINGKAKYVTGWGELTLERVYILTEEGDIWKSETGITGEFVLNSNFKVINTESKVINMTDGNSEIRVTEPPYFLLETGKLVNEQGSSYDELEGNFIASFGNVYEQIYVSKDYSISYYDFNTRKYIKIEDEKGYEVKIKDAFVQWGSFDENVDTEEFAGERLFVITEGNELLYINGYTSKIAKKYPRKNGIKVNSIKEETEQIQYGTRTNVKIEFADGTSVLIKDAYRNFFGNQEIRF